MLYPIGIQQFEKIRKGGFLYLDKTDKIFQLASSGCYYFLSRPRRFGKSLLASTMDAYFSGRRDLFHGLAIEGLERDWTPHPVLHLDLSGQSYTRPEALDEILGFHLSRWEGRYGVTPVGDPSTRFRSVIAAAHEATGEQAVLIVDEYDKPILDTIGRPELQDAFREELQGFYGVTKAMDGDIRFGFLTGVTKIGKMSVFSGLNNLTDISMDARYADICGVTDAELHGQLGEGVRGLAESCGVTEGEAYARLAEEYDGYRFHQDAPGVYNPFSLLSALSAGEFRDYWFETGTPSFLVEVMRKTKFDVTTLADKEVDSALLSSVDTIFENPIPILFQSGYLTITGYDPTFSLYRLGFPNGEVKRGFLNFLMKYYVPLDGKAPTSLISQIYKPIRSGDPEALMRVFDSLFANTSYQIQGDCEKDFQYALFIIFELLGEYVQVERPTSDGRMDMVVQTDGHVFVFEFKVNVSPEAAIQQIRDKGYDKPFAASGRKVHLIGVNFSTKTRSIDGWRIEEA